MKHLTLLLVIVMLLGAVQACCQMAYTDPEAFDEALEGFVSQQSVGFDSQGDRTPAVEYDALSISSRGLDSDGETAIELSPIATAAYKTTSGPNSLGVDFEHTSFLSGNSDSIDFRFSSPVQAFGVYLIGNPSPTGDPAIPFWKMRVYVTGGYYAYSGTEPLFTLPSGDGVYFLGVISPANSFSRVTIYSDNDPDAVFSFTMDDIIYATAPGVVTIVQAKGAGVESITLPNVVVTRTHADRFNVQSGLAGISVLGLGATRGQSVTLIGVMTTTPDGERVIDLRQIASSTGGVLPGPLRMRAKAVGGKTAIGLQPGTLGAWGPNNVGIDAMISGKVSGMDAGRTWMTVDDGSGRESGIRRTDNTHYPGVKVIGAIGGANVEIGSPVMIRGSVSMYSCPDGYYPLIRVAEPTDVMIR